MTTHELNPEEEGTMLAKKLGWCGQSIFDAFCSALTEANFHYERTRLQEVWDRLADQQALSR